MDSDFTIAKCEKCHQVVPFDKKQRVCFCMYCGSPITSESCIPDDEPETAPRIKKTFCAEDILGIIEDEFKLQGHGLVITTQLKNSVSVNDNVVFLDKNGIKIDSCTIKGIEYNHHLLDNATTGQTVGLLLSSDKSQGLIGSLMIFDR